MNLFELFVKISVDDTGFKKSMENAQKVSKNVAAAMKNLQSPLDKAKSGFNAIAHPVETAKANIEKLKSATEAIRHPIETFKNKVADASTALETKRNKLATLSAGYDAAKKKVADITKEFNKSAKESGTSSQKTQELAKKLNEAEKEAEEAKKELDDYSASVSKAGKNSDSASKGVGNFASKLGKGIATAGKIGVAAVGAAAAGVAALTTAAVNNYAEYEQLVGGVETLFGKSADTVQQYAANAYKTAGMSANDYMANATAFSASLISSLGDDTEKAAEYANRAMVSMSDNANKMGTNIDSIVQTYQSLARGNFAMLDNLKLGYGGTKAELERLIADAASYTEIQKEMGITVDASSTSFDNIVNAIAVVQGKLGIAGATALEAGTTIEGSVNSMKAAWSNLVTGVADDNADFEQLINNFVESVGATANNILPRVQTTLVGAGKLVETLVPIIIEQIPDIVEDTLPKMLKSGIKIIQKILEGIEKDPDRIVDTVFEVINMLIDAIVDNLPQILSTGALLLGKFAIGIIKAIPDLVRRIPEVIRAIKDEFSSHSGEFSNIGDEIINGVWSGIQSAIGWFTDKVSSFFSGIVDSVKETLGIHSPSRVFAAIGKNMAQGVGVGWDDEFGDIQDEINGSLEFGGGSVSLSSVNGGVGGRTINITQNIYSQKKSAAQLMQEARWQAQMGVLANA